MKRRLFLRNLGLLSAFAAAPAKELMAQETGNGLAGNEYKQISVSGKVTAKGGKALPDIVVSDGFTVAITDNSGKYSLKAHPLARYVFISVPAGYEIPAENGIARFYHELGKDTSFDFELEPLKQDDNRHKFIVWADPQIRTDKDAEKLLTISTPDTKAHVKEINNLPMFGIGCGDLVWDKPHLYKDYKRAVGQMGIPFYQLIGNHDQDYDARTDDGSQATFNKEFGPVYYSFNRGKVHYVVLDDVFFVGEDRRYIGYITETQLQWLEKDLQVIPDGSLVVVALHIPTNTGDARRRNLKEDEMGGVVMNRKALYDILKNYKVQLISGHTHWNEIWENGNMMEHNLGTVCGAWWTGPFCGDGTPDGYAVFDVDGDHISWYYKSIGYDKNYQMKVYKPGEVTALPGALLANIWNYDAQWKIEWYENDRLQGEMEQYTGYDPVAYDAYIGPELPSTRKWVEPILTDHLFVARPSSGARKLKVKATDRFGNIYEQEVKL